MTKEKQINELRDLISLIMIGSRLDVNSATAFAETLYGRGYRKQSGWISVDERLPNEGEDVLAFCYYHEAYQPQVCYLSPVYKERWITSVAGQWVQVTHWMPLPEPPKVKGGVE